MRKLYENFRIFHFQKRIVSTEIIRENTVYICDLPLFCHHDDRYCHQNYCVIFLINMVMLPRPPTKKWLA